MKKIVIVNRINAIDHKLSSSDIDDVILNTSGSVIGYFIYKFIKGIAINERYQNFIHK